MIGRKRRWRIQRFPTSIFFPRWSAWWSREWPDGRLVLRDEPHTLRNINGVGMNLGRFGNIWITYTPWGPR